jgi:hypothetical protein
MSSRKRQQKVARKSTLGQGLQRKVPSDGVSASGQGLGDKKVPSDRVCRVWGESCAKKYPRTGFVGREKVPSDRVCGGLWGTGFVGLKSTLGQGLWEVVSAPPRESCAKSTLGSGSGMKMSGEPEKVPSDRVWKKVPLDRVWEGLSRETAAGSCAKKYPRTGFEDRV